MRNVTGLKVETRIGIIIVIFTVTVFLVTIFKSLDIFDKFIDRINLYEQIQTQKELKGPDCSPCN